MFPVHQANHREIHHLSAFILEDGLLFKGLAAMRTGLGHMHNYFVRSLTHHKGMAVVALWSTLFPARLPKAFGLPQSIGRRGLTAVFTVGTQLPFQIFAPEFEFFNLFLQLHNVQTKAS